MGGRSQLYGVNKIPCHLVVTSHLLCRDCRVVVATLYFVYFSLISRALSLNEVGCICIIQYKKNEVM